MSEEEKEDKKPVVYQEGRNKYTVQIPPNATPEEIKAFMDEFMKKFKPENHSED